MKNIQSRTALVKAVQCRKKAAKVKARLLNIDRLCFALMLLTAALSSIIDTVFLAWLLFVITLALFVCGIMLGKRINQLD